MENVNYQPPRRHPEQRGTVWTDLAADPAPPGAGPTGWRLWTATTARLLLATVWAWAALAKISDPDAAVRAVRAYQLLPEALVRPVAWGLPFAAALTGAELLLPGPFLQGEPLALDSIHPLERLSSPGWRLVAAAWGGR